MQRGVVAFAALTLILGAGAVALLQPERAPVLEPAPSPAPPAAARPRVPPADEAPRATLPAESWATPEELREEPLPPDPNPGTIRGRIVDEATGGPAIGVQVVMTHRWLHTVAPGPEDREFFARINDARLTPVFARTDAFGRFTLHPVRAGITQFLAIGIGSRLADLRKVEKLPQPGETVELDPIVLAARGTVTGKVAADVGDVRAVRVRVIDDPVLTNPLATQNERTLVERSARAFVDEIGSVGSAARDRLLPFAEAGCDADGRFAVPGVRPGRVTLLVQVPGHFALTRQVIVQSALATDAGTLRVESRMRPVRVNDGEGRPLAGVEVVARIDHEREFHGTARWRGVDWRRETWTELTEVARTDPEGRCELVEPALEERTEADDEALTKPTSHRRQRTYAVRRQPDLPWETADTVGSGRELELRVHKLAREVLFVLGPQGTPVPATVRVLNNMGALGAEHGLLPLRLQPLEVAPGRFEFAALPSAIYTFVAFPVGCAPIVHEEHVGSAYPRAALADPQRVEAALRREHAWRSEATRREWQDGIVLRAQPTFPLTVRVSEGDERPVPGAEVFAVIRAGDKPGQDWHRLSSGPIPLGRTGRDGTLRVGQFWACTACIGVRRSGGWIAAWREHEFQQESMLALQLDALGEVTGRLVERWVSPHSPWLVTLEPRQQSPYLETRRTVTGTDGTFAFHDQAPGPYLLKAGHPDAPAIEVELAAGQRRFVMLGVRPSHLDHDAPLRGRITIDGAAADGLLLRLTEQPRRGQAAWDGYEPWADAMFTDKEGLFSFRPQLRASGSFELSVERLDRGVAQRITRTWWHGRADRLELDLHTGAARLDLSHRGGLPVGNRKVVLEQTGDGGARFEAITTPRGFATIERMPAGEYAVYAEGCAVLVEGGRAKLQVKAGEDTVARFVFL